MLRVGPLIVKHFLQPADTQIAILNAFEEIEWRDERIDDPLPFNKDLDPKEHLKFAIKNLNRHQKTPLIHFRAENSGQAIAFEMRSFKA